MCLARCSCRSRAFRRVRRAAQPVQPAQPFPVPAAPQHLWSQHHDFRARPRDAARPAGGRAAGVHRHAAVGVVFETAVLHGRCARLVLRAVAALALLPLRHLQGGVPRAILCHLRWPGCVAGSAAAATAHKVAAATHASAATPRALRAGASGQLRRATREPPSCPRSSPRRFLGLRSLTQDALRSVAPVHESLLPQRLSAPRAQHVLPPVPA